MTQKTKLEILGPYTPEHEGPYVWGNSEVVTCTVHSVVKCWAFVSAECVRHPFCTEIENIHNAREVPVAREFWVNEYGPNSFSIPFKTLKGAEDDRGFGRGRTIHVREVLKGGAA